MRNKIRPVVIGLALAAVAVAMPAAAADTGQAGSTETGRGCLAELEDALRQDMESFRDFDADAFREGHDERAITVFPNGRIANGIDEIMTALGPHFHDRNAVWTWTETHRVVEGCKTAFVVYDARYEIPSIGFRQHQVVAITWIRKHGKWLAVADTNTLLPL
jgi:hypothetical protein